MADVDELLRDAQYAFQNISHGQSRENRKNSARAKYLAKQIIRKSPTSSEAEQAQQILTRLNPEAAEAAIQRRSEHPFDPQDQHEQLDQLHRPINYDVRAKKSASVNRDWKKLLICLTQIHGTSRNFILVALFLLVTLLPYAALAILTAIVFLAGPFEKLHPPGTQENLDKLYTQLDTWTSNRR